MDINIKNTTAKSLLVEASGRLDLDNAVEYGSKIKDAIEDSNEEITEVTLNFSDISFISSFGLKVILEIYKQLKAQNGALILKSASEQIINSFKMVGFDKFLVFE